MNDRQSKASDPGNASRQDSVDIGVGYRYGIADVFSQQRAGDKVQNARHRSGGNKLPRMANWDRRKAGQDRDTDRQAVPGHLQTDTDQGIG